MTTFKTAHGFFWNAYFGGGPQGEEKEGIPLGLISARAGVEGPDESFTVEVLDESHIAIRSYNAFYVCAELGGNSILVANRQYDSPGPWEIFAYEIIDEETNLVAFKADSGRYICAELNGDISVNREVVGPWESFTVSEKFWKAPVQVGNRIPAGIVRLENGRVCTDDNGAFLAIGPSFFWSPRAYRDYPDRYVANMKYSSENGFNFYRGFVLTGGWEDPDAWSQAGSKLPWALEILPFMLDDAYTNYNLRCSLTLFDGEVQTPTDSEQDTFVNQVCDILIPRMHTIQDIQVANEYGPCGWDYEGGVARLRRHAQTLRNRLGGQIIISISSRNTAMSGGSEQDFYDECHKLFDGMDGIVTATCNHDSRDTTKIDQNWRHVRQGWERVVYQNGQPIEPDASIDDEPMGPRSSVAEEESPSLIIQKMLVSFVSGRHQYCYHTDAGIWSDLLNPAYVGNPPGIGMHKLIQDHPASMNVGKGVLVLNSILPPDLPVWSTTRHGIDNHPFARSFENVGGLFTQIWPDGITEYGVVRAYCALEPGGNGFITPLTGVRYHFDMKWQHPMKFKVYKCSDMELVHEIESEGNEQVTLQDSMDTDYLVIGKYV